MAYLRMAAKGLPVRSPAIFLTLAEASEKHNDIEAAKGYREQIKRVGLEVGTKNLPADQREIYFKNLSRMIQDSEKKGDFAAAAADQRLMLESGQNELENYRKLADYYEKAADPLNALLANETALIYKSSDADLLARKDKYYFSVLPERLQAVRSKVDSLFDTSYCTTKANTVLAAREQTNEMLEWGNHLTTLASVMQPDSLAVKLLQGRYTLRLGDRMKGIGLLEDVREGKPTGGAEKEAWYTATRILGELYLNELKRPDLALACFLDYKEHQNSGADTLYYIAQAYEAQNDIKNAMRFYDTVTAYENHPKYWDAQEAIRRLKG
jgi:predicted Zn-dependent protease